MAPECVNIIKCWSYSKTSGTPDLCDRKSPGFILEPFSDFQGARTDNILF